MMFENTPVTKRDEAQRIKSTNCFDCSVKLNMSEAKLNPSDEGDKRFFCALHFKKRFGKKKKLIKRF